MAELTQSHPAPSLLRRIGEGFWNGLIAMGENCARARMVQQLNSMSDAELEAHGTTRLEVTKRIFSDGYHI